MQKLLLGTVAAAALSAASLSAPPLWAQGDDLFTKLDADKDGFVALDEVEGDGRAKIERMLRTADKDGDKKLSKEEFTAALKEPDQPRQPLGGAGGAGRPGGGQGNPREVLSRLDADKDGKLSKDEAQGPIKESFDRLDANSDGFVVVDELAPFGGGNRPDPKQLEAMFDKADANGDGKLTKDEIPEDRRDLREMIGRFLERDGGDSLSKEQFVRFMAMMGQQGGGRPGEPRPGQPRPDGPPPGAGRPPLFVALDADNDGELSAGEIEAAGKALLKLDKNSDGKLTREELAPASPPGRPGEGRPGEGRFNPDDLRARLKEADANSDGKLSKEEAPPMLKERFDRLDANSDGFLDEAERKQMFQRFREGAGNPEGRRPEGRRPEGDRPERRPEPPK